MKRQVTYRLFRENDAKTIRRHVSDHRRYVEAVAASVTFHDRGGWHRVVERESVAA